MSDGTEYQPIPCSLHDGYELACMHRSVQQVSWRPDTTAQAVTEPLRFIDLISSKEGEYLIAETSDGEPRTIRLDLIISTQPC